MRDDQLFLVLSQPRVLLTMAFDMITDHDCKEYARCCGYNVM